MKSFRLGEPSYGDRPTDERVPKQGVMKTNILTLAALLLAGAAVVSCSEGDEMSTPEAVPASAKTDTMTVEANKGDVTRALTDAGTGLQSDDYWSSTEYGGDLAWYFSAYNGFVYNYDKVGDGYDIDEICKAATTSISTTMQWPGQSASTA